MQIFTFVYKSHEVGSKGRCLLRVSEITVQLPSTLSVQPGPATKDALTWNGIAHTSEATYSVHAINEYCFQCLQALKCNAIHERFCVAQAPTLNKARISKYSMPSPSLEDAFSTLLRSPSFIWCDTNFTLGFEMSGYGYPIRVNFIQS